MLSASSGDTARISSFPPSCLRTCRANNRLRNIRGKARAARARLMRCASWILVRAAFRARAAPRLGRTSVSLAGERCQKDQGAHAGYWACSVKLLKDVARRKRTEVSETGCCWACAGELKSILGAEVTRDPSSFAISFCIQACLKGPVRCAVTQRWKVGLCGRWHRSACRTSRAVRAQSC